MDSAKVFFACALGGFVGTMVSLQIATHFWWLGLIVGGLVGYLSYEFREVLQALREAWILTTSWNPDWRGFLRDLGAALRYAGEEALGTILLFSNCLPLMFLFFGLLLGDTLTIQLSLKLGFAGSCILLMFSVVSFLSALADWSDGKTPGIWFRDGRRYNPLAVYFYYAPRALLLTLWYSGWGIVHGSIWAVRFARIFFLLVHSDFRLLCGVDAAIGCAIGYFFGNALIGGIAGGVIGIINFEIISKRILHINPS